MARTANQNELSVAELESLIRARKRQLSALMKRRTTVQRRLEELDEKIGALGGVVGGGSRARNEVSLITAIEQALTKAGKPLGVGDILDRVLAAGYTSTSPNFRAIVNQTLIKEGRFVSQSRGIYRLK